MIVEYLELVGFKPFRLNQITKFSAKFTSDCQLVLGTNGSGKSWLIRQLSPVICDHNLFHKTGSKHQIIRHAGRKYVIKTIFHPSPRFYFEVDGEVLNDWGVASKQKELVRQHFGMDSDIDELIFGTVRFSALKSNQRKDWLLKMDQADYTYALSRFMLFRDKYRDVQGALRHLRSRLAQQSSKILSDEEHHRLTTEAKEIHAELEILSYRHMPVNKSVDDWRSELRSRLGQVDQILQSVRRHAKDNPIGNMSAERLQAGITRIGLDVSRLQGKYGELSKRIQELEERIGILVRAENKSAVDLKTEISNLDGIIEKKAKQCLFLKRHAEPMDGYLKGFLDLESELQQILLALPANADAKYSRDKMLERRDQRDLAARNLSDMLQELTQVSAKLSHLSDHLSSAELTCPKCDHRFNLRQDLQEHARLEARRVQLNQHIENKREAIAQHDEYIKDCEHYGQQYRAFIMLGQYNKRYREYFEYLLERDEFKTNPSNLALMIPMLRRDVELQVSLWDDIQARSEKCKLLGQLSEVGNAAVNELSEEKDRIEQEAQVCLTKMERLTSLRRKYVQYRSIVLRGIELRAQLEAALNAKDQSLDEAIETDRRVSVTDLIRQIRSFLASKEQLIHQSELQKREIASLNEQISKLEKSEQAWLALIKAISPAGGVIAEGLFGFIRVMTKEINDIVKRVWSYEMVVLPCALADESSIELDYQFPLKLDETIVSDVSKSSNGMAEIIDLAFKIVAMNHLGFDGGIIALDEIGRTMDHGHRTELVKYISDLLAEQAFGQVFLVSHDYLQYSGIANAQFVVMCPTNVVLPQVYNDHVVIEK